MSKNPRIEEEKRDGDDESESDSGDSEEGSTESSEVTESEEAEDEPPRLKYQRLGGNVVNILKSDEASCMCVHNKFLVLGTRNGVVFLLDVNGHETKRFDVHQAKINEISVDEAGEYMCSCSDDGKVAVHGLYSGQYFDFAFQTPILSVAIDPKYGRGGNKTRQFFCGDKKSIIRNSKSFWKHTNVVIHSGEGPVQTIAWKGTLVAWANNIGVKIFDTEIDSRITFIERPPKADQYKCQLCWENERTIIIGWGESIKIGLIKERNDPGKAGLPSKYVEIRTIIQTDFKICGIAPFGDYLVALAFIDGSSSGSSTNNNNNSSLKGSVPPELRILSMQDELISQDVLQIKNYQNYDAKTYRLDHLASESYFYIVSPQDIVVAKPRDLLDHVRWLLEKTKFSEALKLSEDNAQLMEGDLAPLTIGIKYLKHLVKKNRFSEAAKECPRILKIDKELWKKWILKFIGKQQLPEIAPYIPVGKPFLDEMVYEAVLNYFLQHDQERFLKLINEWPRDIYKRDSIIASLAKHVGELTRQKSSASSDPSGSSSSSSAGGDMTKITHLMDAMAQLYMYDKQYSSALKIYLDLRRPHVFDLIDKYDLFDDVRDKVLLLMEANEARAIALFIRHMEKIQPGRVLSQLRGKNEFQLAYLRELIKAHPNVSPDFKIQLIELYAEYDRKEELALFLKTQTYPVDRAYQIVERKNLYDAMYVVLERMGNHKEALQLLVHKMNNVEEAVKYAMRQRDKELWDDLIRHALAVGHADPSFISGLLKHIHNCEFVTPLQLIEKLPEGMKIPHLDKHLIEIIGDYNLQTSLRQGCNTILKSDCVNLLKRQNFQQRRGVKVDFHMRCTVCTGGILSGRSSAASASASASAAGARQHLPLARNSSTPAGNSDGGFVDSRLSSPSIAAAATSANAATTAPSSGEAEDIVVFFCKHVYHRRCLQSVLHSSDAAAGGGERQSSENVDEDPKAKQQQQQEELKCVICRQKSKKKPGMARMPSAARMNNASSTAAVNSVYQ